MKKLSILLISILLFSCKKENINPIQQTPIIFGSSGMVNNVVSVRNNNGCGNGNYNGTIKNPFDGTMSMNVQFDLFENNITYFDVTDNGSSFSGWGNRWLSFIWT